MCNTRSCVPRNACPGSVGGRARRPHLHLILMAPATHPCVACAKLSLSISRRPGQYSPESGQAGGSPPVQIHAHHEGMQLSPERQGCASPPVCLAGREPPRLVHFCRSPTGWTQPCSHVALRHVLVRCICYLTHQVEAARQGCDEAWIRCACSRADGPSGALFCSSPPSRSVFPFPGSPTDGVFSIPLRSHLLTSTNAPFLAMRRDNQPATGFSYSSSLMDAA